MASSRRASPIPISLALATVLLVTHGASTVARAQAPAPDAAARLAEARAACASAEYPTCAETALEVIASGEVSEAELIQAHLLSGEAHRVMGKNVEARMSYRWVLARRPDFELSPDTSPKIRLFFELVKRELQVGGVRAPGGAVLRINTVPAGAGVSIDGISRGPAPVDVTGLSAGPHQVRIEPEGHAPVRTKVELTGEGTTLLEVDVALSIDPVGPQARLDYDEEVAARRWWLGAKIASGVGVATTGCCLSPCALGFGVWLFGLVSVPSQISGWVPVAMCCGCQGVSAGAGGGLGAWGIVDLSGMPESPPPARVVHRVRVHPPEGQGEVRTEDIDVDQAMAR